MRRLLGFAIGMGLFLTAWASRSDDFLIYCVGCSTLAALTGVAIREYVHLAIDERESS